MTYHLSTPESHREVHGNAIPTLPQEETLRRLRTLERLAQAVVDAAYEERVKLQINDDGSIAALTVRRCRLCNSEGSTHSALPECPIEALERLLRGAP